MEITREKLKVMISEELDRFYENDNGEFGDFHGGYTGGSEFAEGPEFESHVKKAAMFFIQRFGRQIRDRETALELVTQAMSQALSGIDIFGGR